MNQAQIQNIYNRQLDYYLEVISFLGISNFIEDYEILSEVEGYKFTFRKRAALDVFALKILTVINNMPGMLVVDVLAEENVLYLKFTERNG